MKHIIIFFLTVVFVSCSNDDELQNPDNTGQEVIEIPVSTVDYNDLTNWYFHPNQTFNFLRSYSLDIAVVDKDLGVDSVIPIENNAGTDTGLDVFWVHPTHLDSPPNYPTTVPIADQSTIYIGGIVIAQGALLSKYGRFYAPKYRQASPASFLDFNFTEGERATGLLEAYSDVKAAFLNYLDNYNNGNKIILAGHSQGSFLLAMLLRDIFDNDPQLRDKLYAAALGGMGYVYASSKDVHDGWWENIKLCTTTNECGCVHYWRSYRDDVTLPLPNATLPSFSQEMVSSGLVYRTSDLNNDLFLQDSLVFGSSRSPVRYITPGASYDFGDGANFLAFDDMYQGFYKRESNTKVGLSIEYIDDALDQRPNELNRLDNASGDFHTKDYHIYLWALMEQLDEKISNCY